MISLFGKISLTLALLFATIQSILPLFGYWKKNSYALACARPCAYGQFIFVFMAYILLTIAFATNDFSIIYVAHNSHITLPLMYKLTAVWGAHEGSILLWILILNTWTIIFSFVEQRSAADKSLVLAILGIINFCFLCFLTLTSNPFISSSIPLPGQDLNPLLQDPGFIIHPPMLYIGYVGFAVAFAITQAALIRNQLDTAWAAITRKFVLAAWCFLTLGITLGSWWAYRVLGWGGFWFWDPVENASLLPWIAGTALIHVLVLAEKRGLGKNWAALLTIVCFGLSLLGTFLVRSGVLISAHTFASDPARGVFLLLLFTVVITLSLFNYFYRLTSNHSKPEFTFFSREIMLLLNSALLFIAMLTILLGTLYPLILDALHLGAISVGAPYFNLVMAPLVLLIMAWMGLAPYCYWREQKKKMLWLDIWKKIIYSIAVALVLLWYFVGNINLTSLATLSLSIWILASIAHSFRTHPAMSLTHLGFAVLVLGIMFSSLLSIDREVRIKPGDITILGPYQFYFLDTVGVRGENFRGIRAQFEVVKNTRHITTLYPEKRIYTVRDMVMTKVDINPGIFRDLYIALGEPLDGNEWSVRIYYKPLIRWIWIGGIMMMIGGILAMRKKKTI